MLVVWKRKKKDGIWGGGLSWKWSYLVLRLEVSKCSEVQCVLGEEASRGVGVWNDCS